MTRGRRGDTRVMGPHGAQGAHGTLPSTAWETASRIPAELKVGALVEGRYRVLRRLGAGAMGEVFECEHTSLGIRVAMKVLRTALATQEDHVRRFRREAYAASALAHENIVRVLDSGQSNDLVYMIMELCPGQTLGQWLHARTSPPPLWLVREIAVRILDGLHVAHEAGVVHRDLKPDNILVSIDDAALPKGPIAKPIQLLKIADFGLARVQSPLDPHTLTATHLVAGTPAYMSPEQCRSLAVGPSTDLYSFGCILTELLQLATVFEANNHVDLIAKHLFAPAPPLRRPVGGEPVPELLEQLRLSLLAKDLEFRPDSALRIKAMLLEAFDPVAAERALPSRSDALRTARSIRAPWPRGREPLEGSRDGQPDSALPVPLWILGAPLDETTTVALASHAIEVQFAAASVPPGSLGRGSGDVALLQVGRDIDAAERALHEDNMRLPLIVCVEHPTTEDLTRLARAGAADVLAAPIRVETLVRKVRRLSRRS